MGHYYFELMNFKTIQVMWYNYLVVVRQNLPIMSILTDFTLGSCKDFNVRFLLIGWKEMIRIISFNFRTLAIFWGLCFGLDMTSVPGFKAQVYPSPEKFLGSLIYNVFRFTSCITYLTTLSTTHLPGNVTMTLTLIHFQQSALSVI